MCPLARSTPTVGAGRRTGHDVLLLSPPRLILSPPLPPDSLLSHFCDGGGKGE